MTVGIALGAGGPLGWAFHLGVLDGIRDALGVEPADAQRVVGTSAGGAIAASLLSGADSETVLASISQPMSEADQAEMRAAIAAGAFDEFEAGFHARRADGDIEPL